MHVLYWPQFDFVLYKWTDTKKKNNFYILGYPEFYFYEFYMLHYLFNYKNFKEFQYLDAY